MKVRMKCSGGYDCFKEGDIVDCRVFDDNGRKKLYECKDRDGIYWLMFDYEFEILEDEPIQKEPLLLTAIVAKEIYDSFIKAGFSKQQAFKLVSQSIIAGLTN